ncbi:alkylation response protein AidB-like acyl-CoA dehydrogenase [Endobacter medicaginis]|uniref:Alkylation response protein AidB-like acyl-CoA dehydrogenase n=3 Tax=Endobacter medicaginis TaxID=1181271 RepID=A0A839UWZ0_9PROT|nr:acyl-CoA dehydrogenase family protein [Endobacter medicaginis]MBB3172893.1 alkylation response protein AidB-like acyl-CoA dehydrogenase [Endobacter medicaginis]MCX5474818.1 acyl-CoA/acyl-ACP dehydrogenase [Endobacter medicaginis]
MDGQSTRIAVDEAQDDDRIDAALAVLRPRFAARAAGYDRSGEIAFDNLAELREAGLLALALPRAHGGRAIGLRRISTIVADVARGDPSTALILAMQYLQSGSVGRSAAWDDAVKAELFASIRDEGALVNALRVEPELGTPARGGLPATRVSLHDGVWRLNGCKIFSTGSEALGWGVVWAATDEASPRVGQVLVRLDRPGVRIERSWNQLGMRATGSHTIHFENVEIPARWLVNLNRPDAAPGEELSAAFESTIAIAALYDAIAREARDWLVGFLKARTPSNLGAPLATLPRFRSLLGEIDALLLANEAQLEFAYQRDDSGRGLGADALLVKHNVTEAAIDAVGRAVAAIGNPALNLDNPLERHYRNVLCGRIHTPQGDAVLAAAGARALG